jgi:membrane protease YdiL (CAAX protease family)
MRVLGGLLFNVTRTLKEWRHAALSNAERIKQSRMLPLWLPVTFIVFLFLLMSLGVRYAPALSPTTWALAGAIFYFGGLAAVTLTLMWSCRHYEVSGDVLGIRPSSMRSDFRWSLRMCVLGASVILAAIVCGFVAALCLGIRLRAPPASYVDLLDVKLSNLRFLAMAGLSGVIATVLAPVTEELIYRSFLLPPLTHRIGLYPAIIVTSLVFGLAHVIALGQIRIPLPEIVGGLLMATGFAIRWSIIPAIVIHGMGNLVAGSITLIYVRLFVAYPALFEGRS